MLVKLLELGIEGNLGWPGKHGDPNRTSFYSTKHLILAKETCVGHNQVSFVTNLIELYTYEFGKSSVNGFINLASYTANGSRSNFSQWELLDYTWLSGTLASYFRRPGLERHFTAKSTDIKSTRRCRKTISCILSNLRTQRTLCMQGLHHVTMFVRSFSQDTKARQYVLNASSAADPFFVWVDHTIIQSKIGLPGSAWH